MTAFLKYRRPDLIERMDQPDCDPVTLRNTYLYFPVINRWISGWEMVYRRYIRPLLTTGERYHLLDIGSGGGDITHRLWQRAAVDGFQVDVTGADPDPRALEFAGSHYETAQNASQHGKLNFIQADTEQLVREGKKYDFIVCNHVLHHLPDHDVQSFFHDLENLSTRRVICSDIHRSNIGYLLFSIGTAPFFRDSFIREDGLLSIQKSFTHRELTKLAPRHWHVVSQFPFRLLAMVDAPG